MPPFPKPAFPYTFDPQAQIQALRTYRDTKEGRAIPARRDDRLLVATWNIANLGVQNRTDAAYALIAEIVGWFELIAIQEVNDDLRGILAIKEHLPATYSLLFSDASGNRERQAFLYDTTKLTLLEEVGRLSIPPSQASNVKVPGIDTPFPGFDRGPYLGTFRAGGLDLMLVNVHLFFGSPATADVNRRIQETFAVAWWADQRRDDAHTYVRDIVPLGDFNLPQAVPSDQIYAALTARGLTVPKHSSQIGSAIASDSHYDQIAFFPGDTATRFTGAMNVYDFDGVLFQDLWSGRGRTDFLAFTRYYISDHRPLWAEFRTDAL